MKKNSFFTLFVLILSFLFVLPLKATINDNYKMSYNYNSNFVIQNYELDFFGENGYLERLRTSLNANNSDMDYAKYLIAFTKNDIIVFVDYNTNSEFRFFNEIYSTFGRISINSRTVEGGVETSNYRYYYKLSDYSSLNGLINGILTKDNKKISYSRNNYFSISNSFNEDLRFTNFNFFDFSTNYLIPYYSNSNIVNRCYNNNNCDNNDVLSIGFNIYNFESSIPTYFQLFNYDEPSTSLDTTFNGTSNAFKTFSIIDRAHISDSWSYNISFVPKYSDEYSISRINVYGLVSDNGLNHYESLNDKIAVNNVFLHCTSTLCSLILSNSNLYIEGNINDYNRIYIDIIFNKSIPYLTNSFNFSRNNPYILTIGLNDICSECLFLQLTSSTLNTYTFSNSDSSVSTSLYYSDFINNDFAYSSASFNDLSTNKQLDFVNYTIIRGNLGNFNKVLFDNYSIGNNVGLIFGVYSKKIGNGLFDPQVTGAFQSLFYITPNLYWGDSLYTSDRSNISGSYIDSEGNVNSFTINGNFNNQYNSIDNFISSLENVVGFFGSGALGENFNGLVSLISSPILFLKDFFNSDNGLCSPIIIPIPFTNNSFNLPCLSTIYELYIPDVLNIWHIVLYGVVLYYLYVKLLNSFVKWVDPDKTSMEGVSRWL